jgi:hypothetical protein
MKKNLSLILFVCAMLYALCAMPFDAGAANKMWWATCRTGGGDCLDGIDGETLTAGDGAFVVMDAGSTTPQTYVYRLYASSASESDPSIVAPDTNPGTKRWHLASCVPSEIDGHTAVSPAAILLNCGATIFNYGQGAADVNITLPTAAADLSFVMTVGTAPGAYYWRATSATASTMFLDGSVTGKNYVQFATPAAGNYFSCFTFKSGTSTYSWICATGNGTTSTN